MRTSKFFTYFHQLPLNIKFDYQGNIYIKQSSRTAIMQEYNKLFYMGMHDVCFKISEVQS